MSCRLGIRAREFMGYCGSCMSGMGAGHCRAGGAVGVVSGSAGGWLEKLRHLAFFLLM